jgi:hypothetical protein
MEKVIAIIVFAEINITKKETNGVEQAVKVFFK